MENIYYGKYLLFGIKNIFIRITKVIALATQKIYF